MPVCEYERDGGGQPQGDPLQHVEEQEYGDVALVPRDAPLPLQHLGALALDHHKVLVRGLLVHGGRGGAVQVDLDAPGVLVADAAAAELHGSSHFI